MSIEFRGNRLWISPDGKEFKRGGNSQVFRVVSASPEESGQTYALKLYTSSRQSEERHARFLAEINIVKTLAGVPGCVSYVDHGLYQDRPFYVMPYYACGTFREKYLTHASREISATTKIEHFQQVLQIVKRLHDMGLAVRDIKPQNILLDEQGNPAVADFGLSLWCTTPDEERQTPPDGQIGSQGYRAPEWFNSYAEANHRPGDIWSLGRTLWAIFATKNPPNDCETLGGAGSHLKNCLPNDYANLVQSIVTTCTAQTPCDRPTINELIIQVDEVKQHIADIGRSDQHIRRELATAMRTFALQVTNSHVYIDAKRAESETNIRLEEIRSCLDRVITRLSEILATSDHGLGEDFGAFRVFGSDREMTFPLEKYGLKIALSDNDSWNKSVTLRFDPALALQEHKDLSYVQLKFHIGLTNTKGFYWLVTSRDQGTRDQYIVEQLEAKSLEGLVSNKLAQLEQFAVVHFFERIEAHFTR